ncbi:MAG: hypothetical protein ACR2O3_10190 [Rhizobiaceae bacterium]
MRACLLTVSIALLVWGVHATLGNGPAFAVLTVTIGFIVSIHEFGRIFPSNHLSLPTSGGEAVGIAHN